MYKRIFSFIVFHLLYLLKIFLSAKSGRRRHLCIVAIADWTTFVTDAHFLSRS